MAQWGQTPSSNIKNPACALTCQSREGRSRMTTTFPNQTNLSYSYMNNNDNSCVMTNGQNQRIKISLDGQCNITGGRFMRDYEW
jgi:hypothetical protein